MEDLDWLTIEPEPPEVVEVGKYTEVQLGSEEVQYWLGEVDMYGTSRPIDGPHDSEDKVLNNAYVYYSHVKNQRFSVMKTISKIIKPIDKNDVK